jgi:elongation factor 1 alpha-like protein
MGWFNIPLDRRTTFIEPLYPRGGLLGGNPDAAPKMTKLQALAAARKKNAMDQKNNAGAGEVTKPMAGLSLSTNSTSGGSSTEATASATSSGSRSAAGKENTSRTYPRLKGKDPSPHRQQSRPPVSVEEAPSLPQFEPIVKINAAAPSAFAATMFGDASTNLRQIPAVAFTLPYSEPHLQSTDNAFSGPSPDDVVIAAQSKGSAQPAIPRRS